MKRRDQIENMSLTLIGLRGKKAAKQLLFMLKSKLYNMEDPKSYDQLMDDLLSCNIEICPKCRTWCISYMLLNIDGDLDGACDDCRPEPANKWNFGKRRFLSIAKNLGLLEKPCHDS